MLVVTLHRYINYHLYFKAEKNTGPGMEINVLIQSLVAELTDNCIYIYLIRIYYLSLTRSYHSIKSPSFRTNADVNVFSYNLIVLKTDRFWAGPDII